MTKPDWIWRDGQLVAWDKGQVHLTTHSLHYGLAAFEGIRCYKQSAGGQAIFRLDDHLLRLFQTAHMAMLDVPCSRETVVQACKQVVRENKFTDGCYLRPLVYIGEGEMGVSAFKNPVHVAVLAWSWGAYLGDSGLRDGIRAVVSSFRRPRSDAWLPKGKITGQYVNSILAKHEALRAGYNEAILLDSDGAVCEGSGENIFVVSRGRAMTPSLGSAILAGVTRDTVLQLLADESTQTTECCFGRDQLYAADEVFLTGTAAEVTPVREIDGRTIGTGKPGPVTLRLQERYRQLTRGELDKFRSMLTPV